MNNSPRSRVGCLWSGSPSIEFFNRGTNRSALQFWTRVTQHSFIFLLLEIYCYPKTKVFSQLFGVFSKSLCFLSGQRSHGFGPTVQFPHCAKPACNRTAAQPWGTLRWVCVPWLRIFRHSADVAWSQKALVKKAAKAGRSGITRKNRNTPTGVVRNDVAMTPKKCRTTLGI